MVKNTLKIILVFNIIITISFIVGSITLYMDGRLNIQMLYAYLGTIVAVSLILSGVAGVMEILDL